MNWSPFTLVSQHSKSSCPSVGLLPCCKTALALLQSRVYLWLQGIPASVGSEFGTHWCRIPHQCCHIRVEISGITLAGKYRTGVAYQAQLGADTVTVLCCFSCVGLSLPTSLVQEETCKKLLTVL